jgi:hypothetical protein
MTMIGMDLCVSGMSMQHDLPPIFPDMRMRVKALAICNICRTRNIVFG